VARIVIAGATEASRAQLLRLLAASGYDNCRACASAGELRRTLAACEDGVVVIAGAVAGCPMDDLAADFGESFRILLIGRPEALSRCESPGVFKLSYPCAGGAVTGALEMLIQMHSMRLPRRTGDDKALVERAKALIMKERGIPEPEAHRAMQQYCMRHGMRMTEYAERLLQGGHDHD